MKIYYILLTCLLAGAPFFIWAQCPPPGFPQPGNSCPQAPILCENLDGYCATINNNNSTQTFPGCPGWQLNNDEWFAFYAGTTQISIQVTPSNCSQGNQMGLQGGIYEACGPPWVAMDLQCACTQNPFILESSNFVVGQIYWIVLDGCAGNVCDYSIDVLSGSTVGQAPDNPGPITGPSIACVSSTSGFNIAPVNAATMYTWTLTPPLGSLSPNQNNVNVSWTTPGTTELCVAVSNACYSNPTLSCTTVEVLPLPTANISGSGVLCAGTSGSIDLTVTFTGDAPWEFVYSLNGVPQAPIQTSDNPYTLTVTQPGTYALVSVRSVDGNCVGTVSGSSTVTQTTLASTFTVTNSECGHSDGAINLTPAGGTTPYMFNWSNGATTEDLSNIPAGTYSVTVTDANGCTQDLTITVGDDLININVTGTVMANTTCIGGNGSINISVTPAGTYTYNWSNGPTTEDQSNLEPGTYTVTVTLGPTCSSTASFTIPDEPNVPVLTATNVGTTCDLENGSINLSVSGGVTPYTFNWSNGATTEDLSNIPAGTYSVTVTGANGCTSSTDVTVSNNNPPINITGVVMANTTCTGGNGSINVSVAPPGTYTYTWSNGATTEDLANLEPGTYTVTVNGGGSCTAEASFTVPDDPNEPQINASVTQSTCDLDNGSINLSVSGGVPPYTFTWSNGATTEDLNNIPAGTYSVTVTGANGCTSTTDVTVGNNNPPINLTANIMPNTTCLPGGNGSIDLNVAPPGTYTYTWSNGSTSQDLNNMPPGTYSVTVNGAGSCSATADFTIPDDPNEPVINASVVPSTCDLPNGSINVNVSGGVTPYMFLWSNGSTSQNLTNLLAGSYSVTVTGANGCTSTANLDVPNNNPPFNINGTVVANTTCIGGNGSISLTVTPPGMYTYLWSTGATTPNLNSLPPGTYTVTVSAGGSCTAEASFTVPDDPNTPDLSFTFVNPTCGLGNGSINLTVSGGVTPYTYSWSSGQTTQDINNIPPDVYVVTVTGANGCSTVDGVVLQNQDIPITIGEDITPQTSCIVNNGGITLYLDPPNLMVLWSNGSTATNLVNVGPGTYTVTVSAGGTCTQEATYEVPDEREYPVIAYDITDPTCGFANGGVDIEVFGGIEPYSYHWSNNASTQDISNLPAGNYAVTVTTALGCTAVEFFNLVNIDYDVFISGVVNDNNSCTQPNGFIDIDVFPTGTYSYLWSNGATSQNLSNLAAGIYTVTVTQGSCVAAASFEVYLTAVPPTLSLSITPATCSQNNGAINLSVSGGSAPYTYLWSNGPSTEDQNNLPPGTYTVTVTDFFGCSNTASATITSTNIALNITGTTVDNNSCSTPNGSVNISVTPAGSYTYTWSNMAVTEDLANVPAGTYSVTVSAGGNCTATANFTVLDNTVDPVIAANITAAICNQNNGSIDLSVSNGTTPYAFLWSNGATTEDIANLLPGLYAVTVTDANGCSADTTLDVANNASTFSLSGTATALTSCAADNGAVNLTVTPAGTYTYLWSNGATTEDITGLPAGTYSVSVTESGDCTASASFIVADNRTYPSLNQAITPEICGLLNGGIDLSVTSGVSPFTYLWSGGQTSEDLTGIAAGDYTVTVTGAMGCSATATMTVPANDINFSLSAVTTGSSSCVNNNGAIDLEVTPAGAYTYLWSGGQTSQDLSSLPPGPYTVTVSAGGTCTSTATYTVANNTQSPLIAETVSPALCGQSSGGINLTINSGQPPYNFLWSNGATTEDLNGIPAGSYTVTVTGSLGCTSVKTIVVIDDVIIPSISSILTPNTACLFNNGAINLSVNPPLNYTFIWSGGQTTQNLSNLPPGNYTVTVNGGGACTAVQTFTVANNAGVVSVTGVDTDIPCFGLNTGAIDLTVSGGTAPYTYNWLPAIPGSPQDPIGLAAGNYAVTVTDALGCSGTASFSITQPSSAVQISCSQTNNVSVPGASDGAASVNISGGVTPYTIVWSPGSTQSNVQPGVFPLNNLTEGSYDVTVTDANGCSVICSFQITPENCETALGTMSNNLLSNCGPGCLTADYNALGQFLDPDDVLQFVLHEGSGTQIVNEISRSDQSTFCFDPATMSYGVTYYISAVAGDNDGTGNVNLGDYCTIVTAGTPVEFREKPVAAIAPPAKLSCAVSQVDLQGSSDLPGASFSWTTLNGQIQSDPTQALVSVTKAGVYTLIINLNGCADTAQVVVQDLTNAPLATIMASPDDILDCTINEIVLAGTIEGTLNANAIWLSNGQVYANGITLLINNPGTYEFVILDTLSMCSDTALITIDQNQAYPPLFVNPPGFLNCINNTVTLSGGSPIPGIQFTWATVSGTDTTIIGSGANVNVSAPGTYYIIGTDPVNNCKNALEVTVGADFTAPDANAGTGFSIDCFGETAYLDGSASTGLPGFTYRWTTSNGSLVAGIATSTPEINQPGSYTLVVTNPGNGCTDSDVVVIAPEEPVATITVNDPACVGDKGSIVIDTVIGGQPPIQYSLNNGSSYTTQNVFFNLNPGNYTILVQDAYGCSTTVDAVINEAEPFEIIIDPQYTILLGDSIQFNTQLSVPVSEIESISWTPPTGLSCDTCLNPVAKPLQSTLYRITVISEKGCEDRAPVLLIVDRRVDIYVPNIFSPDGDGENDVFLIFGDPRIVANIKSFQIFSRWGEMVFEYYNFQPNNPAFGWDGKFRGSDLNPAVFVWYAIVEFVDGREILFEGDVTLKR